MDANQAAALKQTREQFIAHGIKCSKRAAEILEHGHNFSVAIQPGGGMALIFIKGDRARGDKPAIKPHLRFGAVWALNVAHVTVAEVEQWNRENPQHPVERMPILSALRMEALKTFAMIKMVQDVEDRK